MDQALFIKSPYSGRGLSQDYVCQPYGVARSARQDVSLLTSLRRGGVQAHTGAFENIHKQQNMYMRPSKSSSRSLFQLLQCFLPCFTQPSSSSLPPSPLGRSQKAYTRWSTSSVETGRGKKTSPASLGSRSSDALTSLPRATTSSNNAFARSPSLYPSSTFVSTASLNLEQGYLAGRRR
ncbi:hypothetical protein OF83DRAFT_568259 [Amylostereum chailletii]|nr:hypothetical protein OF83DRAFT_568259 [Amylostereum chailletii]